MSASGERSSAMAPERVLFVTSNGTGLGHLTRCMAIARRLGPGIEPLFFTLSEAAPVVRDLGFPVEYMASHGSPGAGNDWRWSRRLGPRLRAAIDEAAPRALVFDGILPWDPLVAAIRDVPVAIWCRRGMWREGASAAPLARSDRFDAVLEPGDFAADADRGPTPAWRAGAREVPPIVFCDDEELLPRAEAERELGLRAGMTNLLVQLGQGPEVAEAADRCLRALAGRDGVQVAAMSSAIHGLRALPEGIVHLEATYPVSRYYAAFDGAVSAAGYNAFHELIRFGVPAVFVPMERETDDQAARASHAERSGVGVATTGPGDPRLEHRLEALLDPERRRAMAERLTELRPPNGAPEAARWLEGLVAEPPASGGGAGLGARGRRGSGRPLGARLRRGVAWLASVPRTVARLARQSLTRPGARTLVVALGVEGEELERRVGEEVQRSPDPPERTLAVTDSPAIGRLRRLGVGVEQVPRRGERQAALAGGDYGDFLRLRLGLILAQRPRLRRVAAVGEVPAELLSAATAPPRRRARLLR
jgi:UDP:flavonoid glycosyltransferase YjiC (YdhE family)